MKKIIKIEIVVDTDIVNNEEVIDFTAKLIRRVVDTVTKTKRSIWKMNGRYIIGFVKSVIVDGNEIK